MASTAITAWGATRRAPHRYEPAVLPAPVGPRLRSALAREHGREPFGPRQVREAARRVRSVAVGLGLECEVVRGGVDVGGAELDHVWVAVAGHVIDLTLPLRSEAFVGHLRAYVAGDEDEDELDHVAHGYGFEWRVLGEFPDRVRYVGLPVWGEREPTV